MNQKTYRASLFLALALAALGNAYAAPVSLLSQSGAYTQNFDTLDNVAGSITSAGLPSGWLIAESGNGARDNELYAVGTGSSTTGDIYSFGAAGSTERALGSLRSGTLIPAFGVQFLNSTGATITALDIALTGEQWRLGATGRTDRLIFQYSTDATALDSGTYLDFSALDFVTPTTTQVGVKNGNDAANSTALNATIGGLKIAANGTFWLRWSDFDASGSNDGLAIDNFSLTAQVASSPSSFAVPEPGSLTLAGLALLGLLSRRSRY